MRRALSLLAKTTISILLLYLSLHSVDVRALGTRLSRLESGWVVLAVFLLTVQVMLLAVRWRNISAACDADTTRGKFFRRWNFSARLHILDAVGVAGLAGQAYAFTTNCDTTPSTYFGSGFVFVAATVGNL